jgi:hypothetical protein
MCVALTGHQSAVVAASDAVVLIENSTETGTVFLVQWPMNEAGRDRPILRDKPVQALLGNFTAVKTITCRRAANRSEWWRLYADEVNLIVDDPNGIAIDDSCRPADKERPVLSPFFQTAKLCRYHRRGPKLDQQKPSNNTHSSSQAKQYALLTSEDVREGKMVAPDGFEPPTKGL